MSILSSIIYGEKKIKNGAFKIEWFYISYETIQQHNVLQYIKTYLKINNKRHLMKLNFIERRNIMGISNGDIIWGDAG